MISGPIPSPGRIVTLYRFDACIATHRARPRRVASPARPARRPSRVVGDAREGFVATRVVAIVVVVRLASVAGVGRVRERVRARVRVVARDASRSRVARVARGPSIRARARRR
jgi:hypothetical protein